MATSFLVRIAKKPVPPELLKAALHAIGELPDEDRKDMTRRVIAANQLDHSCVRANRTSRVRRPRTGILPCTALAWLAQNPGKKAGQPENFPGVPWTWKEVTRIMYFVA